MRKQGILLAAIALTAFSSAHAQIACGFVFPKNFDPDITNFNNLCWACLDTNIVQRDKLLVFLPGTGAAPAAYLDILQGAARAGIPSIGLMYVNATSVNQVCSTSFDPNCHQDIRLEIIDGTDRTPLVDVDRDNSIENRLLKFLEYLGTNWPVANWGEFLSGTNIVWTNLIVSGHSQGACMAGIIAKQHEVFRCVMFNGLDWWYYTNHPADWVYAPSATPTERYFGFGHTLDPLAVTNMLIETWQAFGMDAWGGVENIDDLGPPYHGSHTFMTLLPPENFDNSNDYHNATVVDFNTPTNAVGRPVYEQLWQYMMVGPTVIPAVGWTVTDTGELAVTFETRFGYTYQPQASTDLVTYVDDSPPVAGTGSIVTSVVTQTATPTDVRVITLY